MNRVIMKSVHIENFRSIKDTKRLEINNKLTIFAGKNESGKTNILKAIQTFYDDDFKEDDVPVDNKAANPKIKINFEMSRDYLSEKLKKQINEIGESFSLIVTRSKNYIDEYEGSVISIIEDMFIQQLNENEGYKKFFNKSEIKRLISDIVNSEDDVATIVEKYITITEDNEEKEKAVAHIISIINSINPRMILKNLIPQIAYFDSFEDMLPDELSKEEIQSANFEKSNKAFINLLYMLNLTKDEFIKKIQGDERSQSSEFKKISKQITQKYNTVYLQEKVSLGLDKNGDKIFIQVFDEGDLDNDTKPSQRSKGFQWFIAFYLLLNSLNKDAIILIDEPGLYLHAKAQEDILRFLQEEVSNAVLFTTHSPYLIDINKLDALNLVRKDGKNGTIVNQKYYNCSDQDTITPLITAIGYNVAKNPLEIGNGLNIITEGISDRFYVLSFLKLTNSKSKINVVPSIGSCNVHLLVSLAIGWNLDYLILLDKDTGATDAIPKLKELYTNDKEMNEKIMYPVEKGTIEDVFSPEDKKKYNISKNRKVISSYNFYKKVISEEIKLNDFSSETVTNIQVLLEKIK